LKLLPQRLKSQQYKVVTTVQKFCRGFISRKKTEKLRNQQKMQITFDYFEQKRQELENDAYMVIQNRLRLYLKQRNETKVVKEEQ
jgi:hypothetical protein